VCVCLCVCVCVCVCARTHLDVSSNAGGLVSFVIRKKKIHAGSETHSHIKRGGGATSVPSTI